MYLERERPEARRLVGVCQASTRAGGEQGPPGVHWTLDTSRRASGRFLPHLGTGAHHGCPSFRQPYLGRYLGRAVHLLRDRLVLSGKLPDGEDVCSAFLSTGPVGRVARPGKAGTMKIRFILEQWLIGISFTPLVLYIGPVAVIFRRKPRGENA